MHSHVYQNGITADTAHWNDYIKSLHEWLDNASGPTSIAYRIERLDPPNVYPRVLTARQVRIEDQVEWVFAHCITLNDSKLVACGRFDDPDFPHETLRRLPHVQSQ